jgi:hypothetical protein
LREPLDFSKMSLAEYARRRDEIIAEAERTRKGN